MRSYSRNTSLHYGVKIAPGTGRTGGCNEIEENIYDASLVHDAVGAGNEYCDGGRGGDDDRVCAP